jgi:predicted flap endonuclease-1-like 5' DNA nuclease
MLEKIYSLARRAAAELNKQGGAPRLFKAQQKKRSKRKRGGGLARLINRLILLGLGGFLLTRWLRERQEEQESTAALPVREDQNIAIDHFQAGTAAPSQPRTAPVDVPQPTQSGAEWPRPEAVLSQSETAPVEPLDRVQQLSAHEGWAGEGTTRSEEDLARETEGQQQAGEAGPKESGMTSKPTPKDDLTVLEGIGPKISSLLEEAGIMNFRQLADTEVARLQEIVHTAGLNMVDPGTWPDQARLLAEGKQQEFKQLIESLKAGRRV